MLLISNSSVQTYTKEYLGDKCQRPAVRCCWSPTPQCRPTPRNTWEISARGQPSVGTRPLTQSHVFTAVAATDLKQATDHSLARSTVNSWDHIICSMPRINTQAMSDSQVRATIHHHWLKNTHPTLTGQQATLLDSWNQDDAPKVH